MMKWRIVLEQDTDTGGWLLGVLNSPVVGLRI
jgi:hypothetical protein